MMKRGVTKALLAAGLAGACLLPYARAFAAGDGEAAHGGEAAGHGLDPLVLAGLALIFVVAKVGGELFERMNQPAVLGELCASLDGSLAPGQPTVVTSWPIGHEGRRRTAGTAIHTTAGQLIATARAAKPRNRPPPRPAM